MKLMDSSLFKGTAGHPYSQELNASFPSHPQNKIEQNYTTSCCKQYTDANWYRYQKNKKRIFIITIFPFNVQKVHFNQRYNHYTVFYAVHRNDKPTQVTSITLIRSLLRTAWVCTNDVNSTFCRGCWCRTKYTFIILINTPRLVTSAQLITLNLSRGLIHFINSEHLCVGVQGIQEHQSAHSFECHFRMYSFFILIFFHISNSCQGLQVEQTKQ